MLIIMSSPDAIASNGAPDPGLVQALIEANAQGNPVALISNRIEPSWFQEAFADTGIMFLRIPGRQNGVIVSQGAKISNLEPYDVLVLASKPEDIRMGKNGGAVLVASGWSEDKQVQGLGILVKSAAEFKEVIDLTSKWSGYWWYTSNMSRYSVKALADLSGYGKAFDQRQFAYGLTQTVKNGGARLMSLLAVVSRSLLRDGVGKESLWGVYPSSRSANDDTEVLSDFTHRLRTTVSRVKLAKKGEPLFIRHAESPKRSISGVANREDPTSQVTTIHLNPIYKKGLRGKHVVVVDDCTTYGVSFGVAAAFLRQAGAASVTGVALGKFGNVLSYYEIDLQSDPFSPVSKDGFEVVSQKPCHGNTDNAVQNTLKALIP